MASMNFRAGTVAVVTNSIGKILVFERADYRGQWQLPQGGIDPGEAPVDGAWRELQEETGLTAKDVSLVGEYPEWTVYEWPAGVKKNGRIGQAQRWFIFSAKSDDVTPVPDGHEFVAWKWVDVEWLIEQVVDFRRLSYERVLRSLGSTQ